MAGKTKLIIGLVNNEFVHLPTKVVISKRSHGDPEGSLWRDTLDATHQPVLMINHLQSDTIFTSEFSIPV
jgi:6-phosphofructokinase 1